jgi:hypothetical protein
MSVFIKSSSIKHLNQSFCQGRYTGQEKKLDAVLYNKEKAYFQAVEGYHIISGLKLMLTSTIYNK